MTQEVDHLTAEVARATSVMQSATTLITTISGHIRDNAEDPAALNALADQLDASANSLAAAVTENTAAANLGGDTTHPSQVPSDTGDGGAAAAGATDTGGATETGTESGTDTSGAAGTDTSGGASSDTSGGAATGGEDGA